MPSKSRRTVLASIIGGLAGIGGCLSTNQQTTGTPSGSVTPIRTATSTPPPATTEHPTETPRETLRDTECDRRWAPDVRWSFETDVRAHRPVVADGTVYFASQDGHLYALDAPDGQVSWQVPRGTAWNVAPAVADGVVTYAGYSDAAAYDAATGHELWSFQPPGENATLNGTLGDDGDAVYLGASNHTTPSVAVENPYDRVYAFDRESGEQLWLTPLSELVDLQPDVQNVTAGGGRVFVTTGKQNGHLVALDASDGSELWRHTLSYFVGGPVVADGAVYQNAGKRIVALDAATGAVTWRADGEGPPGVDDGTVYCSRDGVLGAYAATGGHARWKAEIPDEGCGNRPRVAGGVVYLPTHCLEGNGKLFAFDAESGCRLGSFELRSQRPTTPAVDGNTVYVGGLRGEARMWAASGVHHDGP